MPLDPNISLSYQPPQIQSPLAAIGQVQALKNQQLQSQSAQLELQQQQRTLQAQQVMAQVMQNATTTAPDGTVQFDPEPISKGMIAAGFGDKVPGMLQTMNAYNKSVADLAKVKTDTSKTQQEIDTGNRNTLGLLGIGVQDQKFSAPSLITAFTVGAKNGQINPDVANKAVQQILANPDQAYLQQQFGPMVSNLVSGSDKAQQILTERQSAQARLQTAQTQADKFAIEKAGLISDAARKQYQTEAMPQLLRAAGTKDYPNVYNALSDDMKKLAPKPEDNPTLGAVLFPSMTGSEIANFRHQSVEEQQKAQELALQRAKNAREQKTFDLTLGQGVGPDGKPIVTPAMQLVANYQAAPPTPSTRSPQGMAAYNQFMAGVQSINPDYQGQNYDVYKKTETNFTSGQLADKVRDINSATQHMQALKEAGNALDTGNILVLNRIAQQYGLQTGNSAKAVYDTILHRVGPEISKAYVPGGGGEAERAANIADFASDRNSAQRNGAITASAKLLKSVANNLQEQYNRGTFGKGKQVLFSPESTAALNAVAGSAGPQGAAATHNVGDTVYYQGKPHRISAIDQKTGKLTLEP
jgi:hypothetical protein